MEELGGKDIQDVVKEMEDTEFRTSLESKLPAHNTRVKLPQVNERLAGFDGKSFSQREESVKKGGRREKTLRNLHIDKLYLEIK